MTPTDFPASRRAAAARLVGGSYVRDPALSRLKEPSREAVLRTKILLEAGYLAARLSEDRAAKIERAAERVLAAVEAGSGNAAARPTAALASACRAGWRVWWRSTAPVKPAAT